jgi:hypothetical protein
MLRRTLEVLLMQLVQLLLRDLVRQTPLRV